MAACADLSGQTINIPTKFLHASYLQVENYLKENYPNIKIKHIVASDLPTINSVIANNELILSYDDLKNSIPLFKIAKVNWNFTTPYGLIYGKKPSIAVQKLVTALTVILNDAR